MKIETRDKVLGIAAFVIFIIGLPLLYLTPMIINAITDLLTR